MAVCSSYGFCFFVRLLSDRLVLNIWFLNAFKSPLNFCHSVWNLYYLSSVEKSLLSWSKASGSCLTFDKTISLRLLYYNARWDAGNPYHFRKVFCYQTLTVPYLRICKLCHYGVCYFCKSTEKNPATKFR